MAFALEVRGTLLGVEVVHVDRVKTHSARKIVPAVRKLDFSTALDLEGAGGG